MIFEKKAVEEMRAAGFMFICTMCRCLHLGRDQGLKDAHGELACTSRTCQSPLGGGMFQDYDGPMKGWLHRYCFVCGCESPGYALGCEDESLDRIGCCPECLSKIQRMAVDRSKGGKRTLWTTEGRVGPDRYKVVT